MAKRTDRTEAKRLAALLVIGLLASACAHGTGSRAKGVHLPGFAANVSQIELQQATERYATVFVERASLELEPLAKSPDIALSDHALRLFLRYASGALEAASGQQPELNVLDMMVFVVLTRASVEQYWLPEVFGERARPLLVAMQTSEREMWGWSETILEQDKRAQLHLLIDRWLEAHPAPPRVEWIRFAEFASISGELERSRAASGILASVRAATRTADAALLLSERAMFLAQRTPSLLRVQARLGAREVFADGVQRMAGLDTLLTRSETIMDKAAALQPMLEQLEPMASSFERTLTEARALLVELEAVAKVAGPLLAARRSKDNVVSTGVEQLVSSTRDLSESAQVTIRQANDLTKTALSLTSHGSEPLRRIARTLAAYALLVGLLCTMIFCAGYYVTRRLADERAAARRELER
jgi:hypothetical protein